MFKNLICLFQLSILFLLAGCGLETYQSGDLPSQKRLEIVQPGFPKEKVIELLGQPSFQNRISSEDFFIYSRMLKKSRAFLPPQEVDRDVFVITFNGQERVQSIQHLTLADAENISFDESVSPVTGKELSIMEQLVKNFGRYDAGGRDSSVRQ